MNNSIHPEIDSQVLPAKKLIILLHGVGADGKNMIGLAQYFTNDLPDSHFMAPDGIEPYDQAAYGRQWFNLQDRTPHVMQRLIEKNIQSLMAIIKQKQATLHLTNKETIIIGFSQGTMMGLYLTLIQKESFLCTIGFSGLLIAPQQCTNTTTPICLIHGKEDTIVTIDAMHQAIQYLAKYGIPHRGYKIKDLDHSINHEGIAHAIGFIKTNTP